MSCGVCCSVKGGMFFINLVNYIIYGYEEVAIYRIPSKKVPLLLSFSE